MRMAELTRNMNQMSTSSQLFHCLNSLWLKQERKAKLNCSVKESNFTDLFRSRKKKDAKEKPDEKMEEDTKEEKKDDKEKEKSEKKEDPAFEILSNPARVMKAQLKVVTLEDERAKRRKIP